MKNYKKILITGYPPISDWKQNSSEEFISSLMQSWPKEITAYKDFIQIEMMPGDTTLLKQAVTELVEIHQPSLCLFFGQRKGADSIVFEKRAANLLEQTYPDACGNMLAKCEIEKKGLDTIDSNCTSIDSLIAALSRTLP